MKKKKLVINILVLFIILAFIYIGYAKRINTKISRDLEIKIPLTLQIDYTDTHGGFHGDGTTLAKAKLTDKEINAMVKDSKTQWRMLPFTENVEITLYGKEENGVYYAYEIGKELDMPEIKKGYWILLDRFDNKRNYTDGNELEPGLSFNYSIAVIDAYTNIFYYIKEDI